MKPALVLLALLSGASGSWAQNGGSNPTSVVALTPRIKIALSKSKTLNGTLINVDSHLPTKTITLKGTVRTQAQKTLAGTIAHEKAGSFSVRNQLVVRVAPTSSQQKVAGVPARYGRAVQFLQLLARSQKRGQSETFGQRKIAFPASDLNRLMLFVSARGATIVDVNENHGKPLVLSRAILKRDLKRTGSSAFDSFAFAGYIFALNSAPSSALSSTPTQSGVIIEMANGHRFTWARENRVLRLQKLELLRAQVD